MILEKLESLASINEDTIIVSKQKTNWSKNITKCINKNIMRGKKTRAIIYGRYLELGATPAAIQIIADERRCTASTIREHVAKYRAENGILRPKKRGN